MKKITGAMVLGWLVSIGMVLTAVTPALPADAPEWLRQSIIIGALVVAALTHSPLLSPPPVKP